MTGIRGRRTVRIDLPVLAAYFALTPVHQTLVLPNGLTVVRYIALLAMAACVLQGWRERRKFILRQDLLRPILCMAAWFALTILWARSPSAAASKYVQFLSYFALMLVVGSREWNERERQFVIRAVLLACVFFSARLLLSAAGGKRATISLSVNDGTASADENTLACNIGIGAAFAFDSFLKEKRWWMRALGLAGFLVMLGGIAVTGSRGGLAAAAAACWVVWRGVRKHVRIGRAFPVAAGGVLLLAILVLESSIRSNETLLSRFSEWNLTSASGRMEIWGQYLEMLIRRPLGFLGGYGIGCDTLEHADFLGRNWQRVTHNDVLSLVCQAGIPGLLLVIWLVRTVWRRSAFLRAPLGKACVALALIASLDINFFTTYGWWNAMIFAFAGFGAEPAGGGNIEAC